MCKRETVEHGGVSPPGPGARRSLGRGLYQAGEGHLCVLRVKFQNPMSVVNGNA